MASLVRVDEETCDQRPKGAAFFIGNPLGWERIFGSLGVRTIPLSAGDATWGGYAEEPPGCREPTWGPRESRLWSLRFCPPCL